MDKIEKLKKFLKENHQGRQATSEYYRNSYQTQIHKLNAKIEVRREILESIRGEKC